MPVSPGQDAPDLVGSYTSFTGRGGGGGVVGLDDLQAVHWGLPAVAQATLHAVGMGEGGGVSASFFFLLLSIAA